VLGADAVAKATPDGYTLLMGTVSTHGASPAIYKKIPYDAAKDFEPITNMVNYPLLLVAHPSVPAKTIPELLALVRSQPGKINYASPGNGNSGHLAGELFNSMANVQTMHVPYKGQGPALTDLLAGQVQMLYSSIPSVLPHVRQGQLNAIAVGSAKRIPSLPDIPTIAESGVPGYEAYSWVGMVAPAATPRAVVARLNREIVEILK
jgi:tripartite-type tricarboxylate transporter receptor subunit TctC